MRRGGQGHPCDRNGVWQGAGSMAKQLSGGRTFQGTARAKARGRSGRKVLEGP